VAKGADIVVCCTNSMEPVVHAEWMRPGMHFSNVTHWELSAEACAKSRTGLPPKEWPMCARCYAATCTAVATQEP
jgi:ornithine cyclodeaminase/alanine dehydrogenase-like protein (mu-crystallin family)